MPYIGKSPSAGVRQRYQYTATAGQTTFSGTDLGNLTLTYTDNNFLDCFQNGVLLKGGGTDYTATSGTSVVLATGASVSDVIEIIVYDVFSVGNFYNRTDSDSRYVNHNSNTAGTDNFIAGNNAGDAIASGGNYNTLVGNEAGTAITTGDNNTAVGFEALATEDAHGNNTAVGYQALKTLDAGADGNNVAIGHQAGLGVTTGVQNVLIGSLAGDALATSSSNIAIGYGALSTEDSNGRNIAIGDAALNVQNAGAFAYNIAIGHQAGVSLTNATQCTLLGGFAGDSITEGNKSTFIGYAAGATYTTGVDNVHIGRDSGKSQVDCNYNTGVGGRTLEADSGGQNTAVGFGAGLSCTGVNSTFIGLNAGGEATSADNVTALGRDAGRSGSPGGDMSTGDNQIGLGDENVSSFSCQVSLTATSDERDKTDFKDLDLGLDFVNALKPVTYVWDKRTNYIDKTDPDWRKTLDLDKITSDGSKKDDDLQVGFKAQDVIALEDAAGYKLSDKTNLTATITNDGKQYGLRYERFVPMLVKAVQELSAKNDALEARIKKLEDG